jgi:putative hydrolase
MTEIVADLHAHTIASGHGADTIRTICEFACKKNMKGIAITDHGPGLPGGAGIIYFLSLPRLLKSINLPIRIFTGIEEDIINKKGELSLPAEALQNLEIVMAGCHPRTWIAEQDRKMRTEAVINCFSRGEIKVFTHPVGTYYDIELDPVLEAASLHNIGIEINGSKLHSKELTIDLLERCAVKNVSVVVNSDAHTADEVGVFNGAQSLLRETGFPDQLVVNRSREAIESFFGTEW